jgi:hypothetical protein
MVCTYRFSVKEMKGFGKGNMKKPRAITESA